MAGWLLFVAAQALNLVGMAVAPSLGFHWDYATGLAGAALAIACHAYMRRPDIAKERG